jgi:hypothetical protein
MSVKGFVTLGQSLLSWGVSTQVLMMKYQLPEAVFLVVCDPSLNEL